MLNEREEIRLPGLTLLEEHDSRHGLVVEVFYRMETAAEIRVGHGLDIEYERTQLSALMSTATATTRPASSVNVRWPSPIPSFVRMASPRLE